MSSALFYIKIISWQMPNKYYIPRLVFFYLKYYNSVELVSYFCYEKNGKFNSSFVEKTFRFMSVILDTYL